MPNRRAAILAFFIAILLFFFHLLGWLAWPEKISRSALGFLSSAFYQGAAKVSGWTGSLSGYGKLIGEKKACEEKLNLALAERVKQKETEEENDILRSQLNFLKDKKSFVVAEVVGKSAETAANIIIIDRGAKDQVVSGAAVVVGEGILVGKVIKTVDNFSFVRLLNDSQSRVAAAIAGRDRTLGILSGEHNLRLKLTMVPLTEKLESGEKIITSNLEKGVSRGLLIGEIEKVEKELFQPFQTAIVKPLVDLDKLRVVSVLLSSE
ncbi:MAG: rod shape-determining protein MreC [Candidatus Magasanikbacteria bacterium]|nr:rod shape-determining protein MreC [Candidatus Magasanikbacteria bacterium]